MGDEGGGVGDVGGFAAFAAMGDGSEEGGVGFEHEAVEGGGANGFADGGGVFEGGDAGEADEVSECSDLALFGGGADEAVEDGAEFSGVGTEDFEGVGKGIALVDDDVEFFFGGEVELLAEEFGLAGFVICVVLRGAGVVWIFAREAGVIEAAFADGDDFGMVGEGA